VVTFIGSELSVQHEAVNSKALGTPSSCNPMI